MCLEFTGRQHVLLSALCPQFEVQVTQLVNRQVSDWTRWHESLGLLVNLRLEGCGFDPEPEVRLNTVKGLDSAAVYQPKFASFEVCILHRRHRHPPSQ